MPWAFAAAGFAAVTALLVGLWGAGAVFWGLPSAPPQLYATLSLAGACCAGALAGSMTES